MVDWAMRNRAEQSWRRTLITPEGVDLNLRLADAWQRLGAFLIDLLVMVGMLALLHLVLAIILSITGRSGREVSAILYLLGLFVLRNFYFILQEVGPRAATIGKRATGLRVVARSGERLTADRVIARNLMREIEFYLPVSFVIGDLARGEADWLLALGGIAWVLIFVLFPLFNRDRMRIGDLLAGTWVVRAPKRDLQGDVGNVWEGSPQFRFTDAQLDVYGVFELQTLEKVLRDSRPEAIVPVAGAIRRKIGMPDDGEGHDYAFLTAYYNAARARMERGLLFGKRKLDKYDTGSGTGG
ncbi:MAG TPA: RDD family protein [Allosphingosinicella sp.]|nr:RDD family protein [Allosphingosinicella sp.]